LQLFPPCWDVSTYSRLPEVPCACFPAQKCQGIGSACRAHPTVSERTLSRWKYFVLSPVGLGKEDEDGGKNDVDRRSFNFAMNSTQSGTGVLSAREPENIHSGPGQSLSYSYISGNNQTLTVIYRIRRIKVM
jgi:hypothetical protein